MVGVHGLTATVVAPDPGAGRAGLPCDAAFEVPAADGAGSPVERPPAGAARTRRSTVARPRACDARRAR